MKEGSVGSYCAFVTLAALMGMSATTSARAQSAAPTFPLQEDFAAIDKFIDDLNKDGVHFRLSYTDEAFGNTAGGVKKGSTNVGQLQLGADLDMNKLVGIPRAWVHTTFYKDFGGSESIKNLGVGFKEQSNYKNIYERWHFGLFDWEQKLVDDKLDIEAGRTATSRYYAVTPYGCNFSAVTCNMPYLVQSEQGFSLMPSATWGSNVKYNITREVYAQTGLFEVDTFMQHNTGFDFATTHATGVTVPVEVGYKTTFATDDYPVNVLAGGEWSDGQHGDPLNNTKGQSRGTYGGTAATVKKRTGMWLLGSKTVWRASPQDQRNIALIAGWAVPFDKTEVYDNQIYTGAVWTGPIAARSRDSLGLLVNYFRVSAREEQYLYDARVKAGGHGKENPNEIVTELSYAAKMSPHFSITPIAQYIFNPDNANIPAVKTIPHNAVVLGIKFALSLGSQGGGD